MAWVLSSRWLQRPPVATFTVAALAWIVYAWPQLAKPMLFDREAIFQGEWWRLLSGHLVHFSAAHLSLDLLALLAFGILLERRNPLATRIFFPLSAVFISTVLLFSLPELQRLGGLSGLAMALLVYLCLDNLAEPGQFRWMYALLLALALAKIAREFLTTPAAILPGTENVVTVPLAHLAGAFAGSVGFCAEHFFQPNFTSKQKKISI